MTVNTNTNPGSTDPTGLLHSVTPSCRSWHRSRRRLLQSAVTLLVPLPAWAGLPPQASGSGASEGTPPTRSKGERLPPVDPKPLGGDLWFIEGAPGDADAINRGHVSHLLLLVQPRSVWIIGSGPSPAFGRRVAQALAARWPGRTVELISPWAHPESVLGVQGLRPARHWAHEEVAAQMRQRCESCLQRLAHRMGSAADDLSDGARSDGPIEIPDRTVAGEHGTIGPWRWWRLQRAADVTVTVWAAQGRALVFVPGLLWGDAPPDGRDGDIEVLSTSTRSLLDPVRWAFARRWLGQQGGVMGRAQVQQAASYWSHMQSLALEGQDRGDDGLQAPGCAADIPATWCAHARHPLNWQRAWRQAESLWLQRSLR